MQRWMIGLFMTALVLSYQNCGSPQTPMGASGESTLKGIDSNSSQVEAESWTGIEFVSESANSPRGERYHLDLNTGEIVAFSELAAKPSEQRRLCLTEDELDEIRAIIETSSVCEPVEQVREDQMCTMQYESPYAWLVSEDNRGEAILALGEKSNGCDQPTDLCGDHPNLLKGFIAAVARDLDQRSCN